MLKSLLWPGFIVVIIAQWLVPGQMIWQKERTLTRGISYKFQSAPVDPADPFRGRYVVLNFKASDYVTTDSTMLRDEDKVFITFSVDKNGFAIIDTVSETRPGKPDYLETTVSYVSRENDTTRIGINYPFGRFYLQEYKAPKAETIYRESILDSTQRTYALVSLLNGDAVTKDIFINDTSIHEIIRRRDRVR